MSTQYWSSSTILRMPRKWPSIVARRFRICFLSACIETPFPPGGEGGAATAYTPAVCGARISILLAHRNDCGTLDGVKVLISVDMEGISGVASRRETATG